MKITEGKKSGKKHKCNTQKMEDAYIFIQEKKKNSLPTKPQRWQILGGIMKSLEIKE